jgi:hypothetical protein
MNVIRHEKTQVKQYAHILRKEKTKFFSTYIGVIISRLIIINQRIESDLTFKYNCPYFARVRKNEILRYFSMYISIFILQLTTNRLILLIHFIDLTSNNNI